MRRGFGAIMGDPPLEQERADSGRDVAITFLIDPRMAVMSLTVVPLFD